MGRDGGVAHTVQLCGSLVIRLADRDITDGDFPGRRGVLLAGYLVLHRDREVQRGELLQAVWGDEGEAAGLGTLRTLLYRTRQTLGDDRLTGRTGVRIVLDETTIVDFEQAPLLLANAAAAMRAGTWKPRPARPLRQRRCSKLHFSRDLTRHGSQNSAICRMNAAARR